MTDKHVWSCRGLILIYILFKKMLLFIFGCAGFSLLFGFSLVVVSRGYSLVAVLGFLITVASLVAEHRLQGTWASTVVARELSSCGSPA